MKKYFTHLMALLACFVVSLSANAQFSATIEDYPTSDWSWKGHDFSLAEVASTLGTDAATLVAALDAWMAEEAPTEFLFQTSDYVPTALENYAAADRGFWMSLDGVPHAWDETDAEGNQLVSIYNHFAWDAAAGTFTVGIGQRAGALAAGAEGHASLVLAYNGKKATFDITFKVIEKEAPDLPEAETDLTKLTIVGEKTVELDQYPNVATQQKIDLTGVAEALGTTDEIIAENLGEFLFTTTIELRGEDEDSQKPYKTNTLSKEPSAGGIGWWLAAVWDDENDAWSEETARCVWGEHAAFRSMYSEQYSFDAATHTLSCVTGWENYSLELGTKYNFHVYVVYGNKAYHINNVVTLSQKPEEDPSKWEKIGEQDEAVSMFQGDNLTTLSLDVDAIATALGCEVSNLKMYGPSDEKGNIDDRQTARYGGIWFSGNGFVCAWNSNDDKGSPFTFYIEPVSDKDFSNMNVGQNAGATEAGVTYTTTLFFFNGDKSDENNKYYAVNVSIAIEKEDQGEIVDPREWESVATKNLSYNVEVATSGWGGEIGEGVDLDEIETLIGTRTPKLYGWVKTDAGTEYSKDWSCDPKPGFWLTGDGYVTTWTDNTASPFGVCYLADGTFQLFQWVGGNPEGTVRKATFFLVNEQNGKFVTINMTIIFGQTIQVDEIGETSVEMGIGTSNTYYDVDFTEAVKGFEVEKIEDVIGSRCMRALNDDGTWTEQMVPGDGVPLNENGALDVSDDNILAMAWIYAEPKDDNTVTFEVEPGNIKIAKGSKVTTKLAFEYEPEGEETIAKRFVVNITLMDADDLTGVQSIKAEVNSVEVYDLAGRRVSNAATKGIYIVGGRKVVR